MLQFVDNPTVDPARERGGWSGGLSSSVQRLARGLVLESPVSGPSHARPGGLMRVFPQLQNHSDEE